MLKMLWSNHGTAMLPLLLRTDVRAKPAMAVATEPAATASAELDT